MHTAIDQAHFRDVMGHLPTGVVALCGLTPTATHPHGLVVGTFQSLSLEPPLVTFSVAHTSTTWPKLRTARRVCASVLAAGQEDVCRALSSKQPNKFADIDWALSDLGTPRIAGAHAWIECDLTQELEGGDHVIVVARVVRMATGWGDPLIFHKGRLGGFGAPSMV
ncbi:flavin reductase family protein [Streptomyces botrytidirepellens]|uniref:Flavin reductase n=1 Tax=Streptomyces botrytidirepellens TaxID=2486417 RepID=A0A3M8XC22_9ACTN|nr:flavin reductase family protein [Streptomyces botrytidirepellens]RNG38345.1 flavin reductase [Streptomyces botrytidirepellens]